MDAYIETAPLSPAYSFAAAFEPRKPQGNFLVAQTEFSTGIGRWDDFFSNEANVSAPATAPVARAKFSLFHTPTMNEVAAISATPTPAGQPAQLATNIDGIANQRVQLMAAKYAGGNDSLEIMARLEILNKRISTAAPRVSPGQVLALEEANEQLMRIRSSREQRSDRIKKLRATAQT